MGSLTRAFYEKYWDRDQAPPDHDALTEQRVLHFLSMTERKQFVLDLGCGAGRTTRLLENGGKKVIGLDLSREALCRASRRHGSASYVQAACDAGLPFPDHLFDAVFCAEVIEHLLDPEIMIRECHRVLKRSGMLFVSTPYHAKLKNLVIAAFAFERHFDPTGPHIRFFTPESLQRLLSRSGFRMRKRISLGRFWPIWMNMLVCVEKA